MGWGNGNLGGGSVAGLNFKIVAVESENMLPSYPNENTIAIFSETEINGYSFGITEPESPEEGMLWILTGCTSPVAFNALKKDTIMVYPSSAKQYVTGIWMPVQAMTYQKGEWINWIQYLINNGFAAIEFITQRIEITESSGNMTISGTASGFHEMYADNIDLTAWNNIVLTGSFNVGASGSGLILAVWEIDVDEVIYSSAVSYEVITDGGATLDVSSLSGKYKVGICTVGISKHTIYDLYLK